MLCTFWRRLSYKCPIKLIPNDNASEYCKNWKCPNTTHVKPIEFSSLNEVLFRDSWVCLLLICEIVSRTYFSGLIQSINESYDQDVGTVEHNHLVNATDVVSVHEQAAKAEDGHQLVRSRNQTEHTLGQVADAKVLEAIADVRDHVILNQAGFHVV